MFPYRTYVRLCFKVQQQTGTDILITVNELIFYELSFTDTLLYAIVIGVHGVDFIFLPYSYEMFNIKDTVFKEEINTAQFLYLRLKVKILTVVFVFNRLLLVKVILLLGEPNSI